MDGFRIDLIWSGWGQKRGNESGPFGDHYLSSGGMMKTMAMMVMMMLGITKTAAPLLRC
ncbi:hypothetical protein ASPTUDRAFT_43478 [Aspergillus tubingensis CBS 134.48]|uniref:Uncharacterized protein n=1 Tax=Aspergillus tubingensis (strain CBS 134.48) TaxID=767770 RepID=A0A1L9N507_ASPTC|nr:hypothetical protein ASPTUDRAFT_43478 [Aspergillus tubingensis CBS 134.48]